MKRGAYDVLKFTRILSSRVQCKRTFTMLKKSANSHKKPEKEADLDIHEPITKLVRGKKQRIQEEKLALQKAKEADDVEVGYKPLYEEKQTGLKIQGKRKFKSVAHYDQFVRDCIVILEEEKKLEKQGNNKVMKYAMMTFGFSFLCAIFSGHVPFV